MPELAVRLRRERETKNTVRYQELAEDGEQVMGHMYVRKAELARLGNPSVLAVTVRADVTAAAASA